MLIQDGSFNAVENALCCRDLVRTHDQQQLINGKNAVLRQHGQKCVLGHERLCKRDQIHDRLIACIRPPGRELKRVGGLPLVPPWVSLTRYFLHVKVAGGVGVVLGLRAVGDDEQLDVLEESLISPE